MNRISLRGFKNLNKRKQNIFNRGFTLIEVLIAMSLMAGLSIYVMQLQQNMQQVTMRLESKIDESLFLSELTQIFSNPKSCTRTFGSYCPNNVGTITDPLKCKEAGETFVFNTFNFKSMKISRDMNLVSDYMSVKLKSYFVNDIYINENHSHIKTCNVEFPETAFSESKIFFNQLYSSFIFFKESLKNIVIPKVAHAAIDSTAIDSSVVAIDPSILAAILAINKWDFSWIFGHCEYGKYSKNLTITNFRVSMDIDDEMKPGDISVDKRQGECSALPVLPSIAKNQIRTTCGQDPDNPISNDEVNDVYDFCTASPTGPAGLPTAVLVRQCPGLGGSFSQKGFKCDKVRVSDSQKNGSLIVFVEYVLRGDGEGRRRSKTFSLSAYAVPKINGKVSGNVSGASPSDEQGVYIGSCSIIPYSMEAEKNIIYKTSHSLFKAPMLCPQSAFELIERPLGEISDTLEAGEGPGIIEDRTNPDIDIINPPDRLPPREIDIIEQPADVLIQEDTSGSHTMPF
jgi:prepilin-type N-terminal cleavage/methylation domain-containing protein